MLYLHVRLFIFTISIGLLIFKDSGKMDFLIDGFPRNQNNLEGWNKEMGEKVNLKFVLFFNCPLEVRFGIFLAIHCKSQMI